MDRAADGAQRVPQPVAEHREELVLGAIQRFGLFARGALARQRRCQLSLGAVSRGCALGKQAVRMRERAAEGGQLLDTRRDERRRGLAAADRVGGQIF